MFKSRTNTAADAIDTNDGTLVGGTAMVRNNVDAAAGAASVPQPGTLWLALGAIAAQLAGRYVRLRRFCWTWLLRKQPVVAAMAIIAASAIHATAEPVEWPLSAGGNGHYYDGIDSEGLTWFDAKQQAGASVFNGAAGHLMTITSLGELEFVQRSLPLAAAFWLGGYQNLSAPDFVEPAGGWRWITGEPFEYLFWSTRDVGGNDDEPNNDGGGEHVMASETSLFNGDTLWRANDAPQGTHFPGFYIEYPVEVSLPGDADDDGDVDLEDLNLVRNHFGTSGADVPGDANDDGAVDLEDLNDVRNNFGTAAGAAAVPEPDAWMTAFVGFISILSVRQLWARRRDFWDEVLLTSARMDFQ